jgi:hypothetical protein
MPNINLYWHHANIYVQLFSFFSIFFLAFFVYVKDSILKELSEFVFKTAMVFFYYTTGYFNDEGEYS